MLQNVKSAAREEHLEDAEEEALVRAAQADPRHFTSLYTGYLPRIYNYIMGRVSDPTSAEDISSRVFLKALEGLPNYQPHAPFAAWLFTIARNEIVTHYRQRQKQLPFGERLDSQPDAGVELQNRVVRDEQLHRLAKLVRALDEEKQEVLRLRFAAGLTYREIASVLGKSEAAVKMAAHRLLRHLQAEWEEQDE